LQIFFVTVPISKLQVVHKVFEKQMTATIENEDAKYSKPHFRVFLERRYTVNF